MKVSIRRATLKDLGTIQGLNNRLFKKEYREYDKSLVLGWPYTKIGKKYFSARIKKNDGFAFVAEVDDKIIGYLVGGLEKPLTWKKWKKVAELENMLVLKGHRGLGIGTKLIKEFLKWCKEKKVENVRTVASHQNLRGINFYKKLGFKETEVTLEKRLKK